MRLIYFITAILLLSIPLVISGQTCCSGGVPLSSNLGLPVGNKHNLQINLSYNLNVLKTLKSGLTVLKDDLNSRRRTTHSVMFQVGYNFTERFAVDAFFPLILQERVIFNNGMVSDRDQTLGIGDAVLLIKYKILALQEDQTLLIGGLGVKVPLGITDKMDDGLLLGADLQPGSGAFDGILWGQFLQVAGFRPSMSFSLTGTFSYKGKNTKYQERPDQDTAGTISDTYQFGNDLQVMAGISDRLFIGKIIIDPSLLLRFRSAGRDKLTIYQLAENDLPSTGGAWCFINPGMTYWINPDFSLNANVELPLYSNVLGTQVTPSYRINVGIYHKMALGKKKLLD